MVVGNRPSRGPATGFGGMAGKNDGTTLLTGGAIALAAGLVLAVVDAAPPPPGVQAGMNKVDRPRWRPRLLVAGGLAVVAGLNERGAFAGGDKPPPKTFPVMEPSEPVRITIPALGVKARVHDVGLADDGSIAVPAIDRHNEAGWYEQSPTPGQYGPAVIVGTPTPHRPVGLRGAGQGQAGHEGGDRPGATARSRFSRSTRSSGSRRATSRSSGSTPTSPGPALRLITCGGEFRGGSIGYEDNIVAFASLVEARDD